MHVLHLAAVASLCVAETLAAAEGLHVRAARTTPSVQPTPSVKPNPGKPEDFASFANVPLWPYQSFVTEPDFHPPVLDITRQPTASTGYLVFAPLPFIANYPDRFVGGLVMDLEGNVIWHSEPGLVGNLQAGGFYGVLKYWTGGVGGNMIDAHGFGTVHVLSDHLEYGRNITLNDGTFKSGDHLQNKPQPSYIDIHENLLTQRETIIVTAYNSTPYDLTSVGGPKDGWVLDSLIYEIDLRTNKTIFRWSSLEHVDELPLNGSHQLNPDGSIINGNNATHPWDYFLTNSVDLWGDRYIISVRHYSSVVLLDSKGKVEWNLNGRTGGDFKFIEQTGKPSTFSWQHSVRRVDNSFETGVGDGPSLTIGIFNNNNGGLDNGTAPSTGLTLSLDLEKKTCRTVNILQDPKETIYADSQGTYEYLGKNRTFIAYGQIPVFKEYDGAGKVVMSARFGNDNQISSYRSSLIAPGTWGPTPYYAPKVATTRLANGTSVLSMSWNGATPEIYDTWLVYESGEGQVAAASDFMPKVVRRTGFETNCTLASGTRMVAAAAAKGSMSVRRSERIDVKMS